MAGRVLIVFGYAIIGLTALVVVGMILGAGRGAGLSGGEALLALVVVLVSGLVAGSLFVAVGEALERLAAIEIAAKVTAEEAQKQSGQLQYLVDAKQYQLKQGQP